MKYLNAGAIQELMYKLKTQGDISLEEADQIYALMELGSHTMMLRGKPHPDPKLPLNTLIVWFHTVNQKLNNGERGNFVFSIPLYENGYTRKCLYPVMNKKYWNPEERIRAIWANQKMCSLFPKYFQDLFEWSEEYKLYQLTFYRVGFCHYPLHDPENGATYTISQVLKKLPLFPAITSGDEISDISASVGSRASADTYVRTYLRQNAPCMEVFGDKIIVFTDKESAPIAVYAKKVSIEDLLKNAIAKNIISEKTAKELINNDGYVECFPDVKFTEASLKYIDGIVQEKLKWEAERKSVEDEEIWLEEIR